MGATTVTVTATDAAGNASTCSFTVTVLYNFTGFFSPVANCASPEARAEAQRWIDERREEFLRDGDFALALVTSSRPDTREFARRLLRPFGAAASLTVMRGNVAGLAAAANSAP